MSTAPIRPLLPGTTDTQAGYILGAMRVVAETGAPLTDADRTALQSTSRFMLGRDTPVAIDHLPLPTPAELAATVRATPLVDDTVKFLTVMALMDGVLDRQKIAKVLEYADALGVHAHYLEQIAEAARDHIQAVLADMTKCNMESITNAPWPGGDVNAWLLPYSDGDADPRLAARYDALQRLDPATFGHTFWAHFRHNDYAFPGEPSALNERFCVPHDSLHVLTGYDTSARGEILVSTFTASMHRSHPMAGHVLPVILSWHLKIAINDVARDASGALDPAEFWRAWAAGAAASVDTFASDWDFWAAAGEPLAALRRKWSIPADGLED
ncbi:MAG: hypothetical protein WDN25_09525 [Acetobacteraceae bacterium]